MPTWESFAGGSYETRAVPYYRSIREEQEARKMNPHTHEWVINSTIAGPNERYCTGCGEAQEQQPDRSWTVVKGGALYAPMPTWKKNDIDSVHIDPRPGHIEYIGDHLGFADYHPKTQEIELNDGTVVSRETVLKANPGMTERELESLLRREASRIAGAKTGYAAKLMEITKLMEDLGAAFSFGAVSGNPKVKILTPEDALQFIIETIRYSDDPFIAGGEWMTKFTNAVTEVIRESEAENDPE